jgi:hypothetical protein
LNIAFSGTSAIAEESGNAVEASAYTMNESFDTASGMYFEKISQEAEFIASVPNGAVVSDGVYFDIPSNITVYLEKDGTRVDFTNKTTVCGQGYYIMKLTINGTTEGVFTFRITAPPSGKVYSKEYKYPKVSCSASITSDGNTGLYKYTLPNYKAFYSSIQQYGQSVESAKFVIPRNLGYSFKKDGRDISLVNNKVYKESGYYTLKVFSYSYANSGSYETTYETVFDFTIPQAQSEAEATPTVNETPVFSNVDVSVSEPEPVEEEKSTVIDDTLLESYYETVGIYGESFSTGDTFYTNTANGAIVGGNVYIDMPFNMSVEMTKDGSLYAFENKTYLNDVGSYIMLVTDESETTTSRASYSFRIQKGIESSKSISQTTAGGTGTSGKTGIDSESDSGSADYDLVNNFDEDRSMYVFNCGGVVFYSSVPDGMFTSNEVKLYVPDSLDAQLYKNGEQMNFSDDIADDGRYTLKVSSQTDETEISFDIASYTVNYLNEFTAPQGYNIIAADYNDFMSVYTDAADELAAEYENGLIEIEDEKLNVSKSFSLPLDGQYSFVLQGAEGMPMLSVELMVDRKPPQVSFDGLDDNMTTQGDSVTVSCSDTEAVLTLTDSDGQTAEITLVDGSAQITGNGKYILTATDGAGNVNEYEFTLGTTGSGKSSLWIMLLLLIFIIAVIAGIILVFKKLLFPGSKDKTPKEKKKKKEEQEKQTQNEADDWEDTDTLQQTEIEAAQQAEDDWEEG